MAIVRKDIMLAGYNGNLEHVKIHNNAGTDTVASTNGVFVVVEGLMDGEREVYKARLASEADKAEDVVFIHNSEVMYDERLDKLSDFVIRKDAAARGYHLFDRDIITLTVDLFDGAVAVGDELCVKTDGKIGVPVDITGAKIVFTVIEDAGFELDPNMQAFAVKVKRN